MPKCFQMSVVTAAGTLLETEAVYCGVWTEGGSLGILADHAPMLCAVPEGEACLRLKDGSEKRIRHSAGVVRVRRNTVTLLADRAET